MATVRRYEALLLFDIGLSEEKLEKIIAKLEDMIASSQGGEIHTVDRWGKKRLAYEINKKQFGYFVLFEFMAPPSLPAEMDRYCRLEAGVVRHQILVIPERVLKLKAKEKKIRAAMDQRHLKADNAIEESHVEDMLEPLDIQDQGEKASPELEEIHLDSSTEEKEPQDKEET